MKCPICNAETKVLQSRLHKHGMRRRRECIECLTRFSTKETLIFTSMDKHLQKIYMRRTNDN